MMIKRKMVLKGQFLSLIVTKHLPQNTCNPVLLKLKAPAAFGSPFSL
jgi:hypothetical protein